MRKGTLSWSTLYLNTKNASCLLTDICLLEEASPICPLQPLHPWSSGSTDLAQTVQHMVEVERNSMFLSCHASQEYCRGLRCLFDSFSHPHSLSHTVPNTRAMHKHRCSKNICHLSVLFSSLHPHLTPVVWTPNVLPCFMSQLTPLVAWLWYKLCSPRPFWKGHQWGLT